MRRLPEEAEEDDAAGVVIVSLVSWWNFDADESLIFLVSRIFP